MTERLTTILDACAAVCIAAGSGAAVAFNLRDGAGLAVSGVVLLALVRVADWVGRQGDDS